ncbi:Xylanase inhibitor, C-terminal [Dillenia turbinata]|uniref:Xylanase inhibitor, C-terminal n=1 Tax=Dillenia turbinata TaxID=194707 RepID=A0AAN8ZHX9_9MAGN
MLFTLATCLVHVVTSTSFQTGFQVRLTRVDHGLNYTKLQLLQRAIRRERSRVNWLSKISKTAHANDVLSPLHSGSGEFLMDLSIGSPPKPFSAIMDTGSDLIWTQCLPCRECFNQPIPIFDPKQSSTYSKTSCSSEFCKALPTSRCNFDECEYLYSYGDDSSTQGVLATETFTFSDVAVHNISFGCGLANQGNGLSQGAGIVGLGRGPLSLVTQIGSQKFSYCMTSIGENKTSSLLFGSLADINSSDGKLKGTPLIRNSFEQTFYYLALEGITVGETLLPIPKTIFEISADGVGGTIIDSGTTLTYLQEDAFETLKRAFISQMKLRVSPQDSTGLDLCFDLPSDNVSEIEVPKLKFHFRGLDLELPPENYMIADSAEGIVCLAMAATGVLNIFGNVQQQNLLVLHDLEKETLSFIPTNCGQL